MLITGTSGFIGYKFLKYILTKDYLIIDILREKNKKNSKLKELKKKYPKNYRSIFFSDYHQLERKIKKLKINYFVNFATLYKNSHEYNDIFDFIKSNILFPTLLYDLISKKANKIINFGSMMQHDAGEEFQSKNFYSATKNAFEMISNFYKHKEKITKFYNLKLYESFGGKVHLLGKPSKYIFDKSILAFGVESIVSVHEMVMTPNEKSKKTLDVLGRILSSVSCTTILLKFLL